MPRASDPGNRRPALLLALGLLLLTAAVYRDAAGFGFVNFDDDVYVTGNPRVLSGVNWRNVTWAFSTNHGGNWHPLTWLSLMADAARGGGGARAFHVTNVFLHACGTLALFAALSRATGALWRSALVAALFAAHPLHVESVAWVAERKDVLSGALGLLAILLYVRRVRGGRCGPGVAVTICLALGLLAKPMLVSLPIILILLDFWPLGRFSRGKQPPLAPGCRGGSGSSLLLPLLREKWAAFGLAAASSAVTLWAQHAGGALRSFDSYPFDVRLANAGVAAVTYIGKALLPARLAVFYPHPGRSLPVWQPFAALAIVAAVTWTAVRWRHRAPSLFVGWFWYLTMLAPVSGIVQIGDQALADRYAYLPLIGLSIAVGWGVPEFPLFRSRGVTARRTLLAAGLVTIVTLGLAARRQTAHWRSGEALFSHAIAVIGENARACNNLAESLQSGLRYDGSAADVARQGKVVRLLNAALQEKPAFFEATLNLGTVLSRAGRLEEGSALLRRAAHLRPDSAKARTNLGMALMQQGDPAAALVEFHVAARLEPESAETLNNLGFALSRLGRLIEAREKFHEALALNPGFAPAAGNLEKIDRALSGRQ